MKPICGNCGKKNRDCQWETPQTKFRDYRPESGSSSATTLRTETEEMDGMDGEEDGEDVALAPSRRQRVAMTGQDPFGKTTDGFHQPSTSLSQVNSLDGTQANESFTPALPK